MSSERQKETYFQYSSPITQVKEKNQDLNTGLVDSRTYHSSTLQGVFWYQELAQWLPGIHPACHLPFTLQNFLSHAYPPDESVAIRISFLRPCLSAPLRTCLCSAIHGLILAGIHAALSDPDRVQKQLSLKRDPSRTLPITSQQQIPTLPVLRPILSHCLCDSKTSG